MLYVVAPVSGTVEAAPESELSEKLPSGDVSVQLVTPCACQKTDVRAPSGTSEGTAQISACAGTVEVAAVVVAAVCCTGCSSVCCKVTCGAAACCTTGWP